MNPSHNKDIKSKANSLIMTIKNKKASKDIQGQGFIAFVM